MQHGKKELAKQIIPKLSLVQGGKSSGPEEISCKNDESAYPLIDL